MSNIEHCHSDDVTSVFVDLPATAVGSTINIDGKCYMKTGIEGPIDTQTSSITGYGDNCDTCFSCSVDIKYDWLLDNGTYETRHTTALLKANNTILEIQDGPTVHTAAETPVTYNTLFYRFNSKHTPGGSITYQSDADKNVTKLVMINGFYNHNHSTISSGPYNNYSGVHDLWFADTYFEEPGIINSGVPSAGDQHYDVIFGSNGDIHQIRGRSNWNQPVARQYTYNQTQIQNVVFLSTTGDQSGTVVSINKTITTGNPPTAQVTAQIRVPPQFVCVESTSTS